MPNISFSRSGSASASGFITMSPEPDFTEGRSDAVAMGVGAFLTKFATVRITNTATVEMQGNNNDPTVAADWHTIGGSLSSTGTISTSNPWEYVRFEVTSYTSGNIIVDFKAFDS